MSKKKVKLTEIFAVIDDQDKFRGFFKSMDMVERFFERENLEESRILTVTAIEDAEYPPEPMLEFVHRELEEVLGD